MTNPAALTTEAIELKIRQLIENSHRYDMESVVYYIKQFQQILRDRLADAERWNALEREKFEREKERRLLAAQESNYRQ